jgi:Spx/MgsR family transcriptional regulator
VTTLYGIKNCDTVKKARKWLDHAGVSYQFHDVRDDGLAPEQVRQWLAELGWANVINKRSTTWKQLPAEQREQMDENAALTAIIDHPTLMKRPLLDTGSERLVGFKEAQYSKLLG